MFQLSVQDIRPGARAGNKEAIRQGCRCPLCRPGQCG